MMRLKIERVGKGLHPNEAVVAIRTTGGTERLVVPKRSIVDDTIEVGWPIRTNPTDGSCMIELPRETPSGAWRVWVPRGEIEEERMRARQS
jgi:hypothetical protein